MVLARRRFLSCVALGTLLVLGAAGGARAEQPATPTPQATAPQDTKNVTVFAAASLKNVLDELKAAFEVASGAKVVISYAASSALAKQIESGAPAQVFISADLAWMDYLAEKKLIEPKSRSNLLGNRLVLIAPKDQATPLAITAGFDLAGRLGEGRLAVADVAAVPAGKYAKAALETLGVWDAIKDKLAQAENVRAALLLVARGESPLGIVYTTDAASDPSVVIIGTFPEESHPPIIYPAALTLGASGAADAFLAYLKSPGAKLVFEKHGFIVLP